MKSNPEIERLVMPRRRLLIALSGGTVLTACGGGGSPAEQATPQASELPTAHALGVGAGGTGYRPSSFISAAVAAVSPVAVNVGGVLLATGGAALSDGDGQSLRGNEIELGMTARVLAGQISVIAGQSVARAQSLVVDTQLRGSATWLDAGTLLVLGQRVSVPATAQLGAGVSPPAKTAGVGAGGTGRTLRVWGQLDLARGRVVASRVALARPGDTTMLRGLLAAIDAAQGLVQVGSLQARAGDASVLPAGLSAGAVVRLVLGEQGDDGVWDLLSAREDAVRPPDGLATQLDGWVTQFSSAAQFMLDGVAVDARTARVEGAAYLGLGAKVSASGTMRAGVLVARELAAEAPEPVEFEGRIDSVNLARQTLSVAGTTLHWSSTTRFTRGTPSALRVGRQVAGVGRWGDGQVMLEASRLSIGG